MRDTDDNVSIARHSPIRFEPFVLKIVLEEQVSRKKKFAVVRSCQYLNPILSSKGGFHTIAKDAQSYPACLRQNSVCLFDRERSGVVVLLLQQLTGL